MSLAPDPTEVEPKKKKGALVVLAIVAAVFILGRASGDPTPTSSGTQAAPEPGAAAITDDRDEEGDDEAEVVERAAEPAPKPKPKPAPEPVVREGDYGSDARLDRLYDRCKSGSSGACDRLFWDSPSDSEYEEFALSRRGSSGTSGGTVDQDTVADLALQMTWSQQSAREQAEICVGMDLMPDMMIDAFMEGAGENITRRQAMEFFTDKCS